VPLVSKSGSLKLLAPSESVEGLLYIFTLPSITLKEAGTVISVYQSVGRRPLSVGILMLVILCHPITKYCLPNTSRSVYHCEMFSFG